MALLEKHFGPSSLQGLLQAPTLFWFVRVTDDALDAVALVGMALSAAVVILGASNAFIQLSLWALYFSIDTLGQRWYSFGWESQLLETGFLSIFLVPLFSLRRYT